jgi:hypothetical protein
MHVVDFLFCLFIFGQVCRSSFQKPSRFSTAVSSTTGTARRQAFIVFSDTKNDRRGVMVDQRSAGFKFMLALDLADAS